MANKDSYFIEMKNKLEEIASSLFGNGMISDNFCTIYYFSTNINM